MPNPNEAIINDIIRRIDKRKFNLQPPMTPNSPDMNFISPYKLTDTTDFPIGSYMYSQTGKPVTRTFSSHGYRIEREELVSIIDERGYKRIFHSEYCELRTIRNYYVYEKRIGDEITIITYFDEDSGNIHLEDDFLDDLPVHKRKTTKRTWCVYSNDDDEFDALTHKYHSAASVDEHPNRVHLVIQGHGGFDTTGFELPEQEIDIETNYGTSFVPIHTKILETLEEKHGKGLVLLHGKPGTGKTHYLKYLASQIQKKWILFIPPYLADFLTSPEMIPFLITNSNSILFIEDAEKVITDRSETASVGVANILNLTDGILSDILNIQIVATFNMDKKNIDKALLRKGRLIAEHEFDALSADESNRLIEKLGFEHITEVPMTLTEIYNLAETEYKTEEKTKKAIGFG